jgi:hypothetical protein
MEADVRAANRMRMSPGIRKLVLSAHLAVSVGWLGAIAAYLPLDIAATTATDGPTLRAAYLGMGWIAGSVIVPLAAASVATGILLSLGTPWGLVRHWWVAISLALTVGAAGVLVIENGTISSFAAVAGDPAATEVELRALGGTLVHSLGGMAVLVVVLILNVYKPRGLTPYGWSTQQRERRMAA